MNSRADKKLTFYLHTINAIRSTGKLPTWIKPQNARYYTKDLIKAKLIVFKGSGNTGLWTLTDYFRRLEGKGLIKKTNLMALVKPQLCSERVKNIRGHGFGMRMKVPKIDGWHRKFEILKAHGYKPEKLKTGAVKIMLDGNKTHLCDHSIVMHFDSDYSFISDTAVNSLANATAYFLRQIIKLESHFTMNFKIDSKYRYKCFKHHFGKIGDNIAKECHKQGKSFTIYRNDGKPWLEIDFSNKVVETETIDDITGVYDMDAKIKPLFDEIDRNPHFLTKTRASIEDLKKEYLTYKVESEIEKKELREQITMMAMSITTISNKINNN